jgi:nucleotide-binding universal stress UspA family protein
MTIEGRRILIPVDFSDHTPSLLEWGAHQAEEHQSAVVRLHAYHRPGEFQQLEGAYLPPDFWASVKTDAEQQLGALAVQLREKGLPAETAVCEGYAATVIVEEAAARDVDLIVIGTHGLSGLKHLLLGSIAERVVQKAPCPVLTVKTTRE